MEAWEGQMEELNRKTDGMEREIEQKGEIGVGEWVVGPNSYLGPWKFVILYSIMKN